MREWDPEQLRRLQQVEMEILGILDRICSENRIRYYLGSGTCLGAMRHGGMIPWDDDIDVYLHRQDYRRLLALLPETLPDGYFLQTPDSDPEYMYAFAKIRKEDTAYVQEALRDIPMHHGIYIDLFPVDGSPRGPAARQWHRARLFFLKRAAIGHILPRKIERVFFGLLYRLVPRKSFLRMYERCCQRYDSSETGMCLCGASDYAYRRERVPLKAYGEGTRVPFGGMSLPVPDDADTYLTIMYGDWRTPPPEAARVSQHAPWLVDFEHAYHPRI